MNPVTLVDLHQPTSGQDLLDELADAVTRYVVLPSKEAVVAVVLWIAATHAQTAWECAPRLVTNSPEKRCGKSRLLDILELTVNRPLMTMNVSTAALFRSIKETDSPTVLLD